MMTLKKKMALLFISSRMSSTDANVRVECVLFFLPLSVRSKRYCLRHSTLGQCQDLPTENRSLWQTIQSG